jgi:hypothetical protein
MLVAVIRRCCHGPRPRGSNDNSHERPRAAKRKGSPEPLPTALVGSTFSPLVTPLRDRFEVEVPDGTDLKVRGKILDHEYNIKRDGEKVAEVSKKWLRMRDTYGIEVEPGEDDVLILAVAVALDTMEYDEPG